MRGSFTWSTAVLLASAAVLGCTLFPFTFTGRPHGSTSNLFSIRIGPELGPDILENALLFLPLGIALAGQLDRKRIKRWGEMTAVLVASFALSYVVEMLQLFVPGRVSSLTDVLANTAGGGLGFLCYSLRTENRLLAVVAYVVPAMLVAIPLQLSTTLRDWEPQFPLIVGNERTGDRPWYGRVFDVVILDRALSGREVADLFQGRPASTRIADSIVASYELTAPGGFDDKAGRLPPLAWRAAPPNSAGLTTVGHRWLETTGPAAALVTKVKQRSAFTLLVTAATADTRQVGPARIVSLSGDPGRRNFTLGQSRSELVFRLRTPLTGENGYRPELVVPGVFSTHAKRHVVVTYDGLDLLTYVDGIRSAHGMRLGLGAAAFAPLLDRFPRASYAYSILFYAVLFLPAGILLSRAARADTRLRVRIIIGATGIVGCSLGFEALLIGVSGRPFNWSNVFWAATFLMFGAVAYLLCIERRIRQRLLTMRMRNASSLTPETDRR